MRHTPTWHIYGAGKFNREKALVENERSSLARLDKSIFLSRKIVAAIVWENAVCMNSKIWRELQTMDMIQIFTWGDALKYLFLLLPLFVLNDTNDTTHRFPEWKKVSNFPLFRYEYVVCIEMMMFLPPGHSKKRGTRPPISRTHTKTYKNTGEKNSRSLI